MFNMQMSLQDGCLAGFLQSLWGSHCFFPWFLWNFQVNKWLQTFWEPVIVRRQRQHILVNSETFRLQLWKSFKGQKKNKICANITPLLIILFGLVLIYIKWSTRLISVTGKNNWSSYFKFFGLFKFRKQTPLPNASSNKERKNIISGKELSTSLAMVRFGGKQNKNLQSTQHN